MELKLRTTQGVCNGQGQGAPEVSRSQRPFWLCSVSHILRCSPITNQEGKETTAD